MIIIYGPEELNSLGKEKRIEDIDYNDHYDVERNYLTANLVICHDGHKIKILKNRDVHPRRGTIFSLENTSLYDVIEKFI
jgi:hypothetical protein